jgi:Tfp pilus assembly protein PilF
MSLKKAKELVSQGQRQQAFTLFNDMLHEKPELADFYTSFAGVLLDMNQLDAAEKMAVEAVKKRGVNADTWLMCARVYVKMKSAVPAIKSFEEALIADEKHETTLAEYGAFLHSIRQHEKAINYLEKVQTPSSQAVLGLCYRELGDDERAEKTFLKTVEEYPDFAPVYVHYLGLCLDKNRYDDYHTFYQNHAHKKVCIIGEAMTLYLENNLQNVSELLERSHFDVANKGTLMERKSLMNTLIYRQYLRDLLKFRAVHGDLYSGKGQEKIHVLGDSHTLSYAGLKIAEKEVIPQLIIGCKIWHLASEQPNHFKNTMKEKLNLLPKKAKVVLSIGEIDCRDDEGFLPYLLSSQEAPEPFIRQTVVSYFSWLKEVTKDLDLHLYVTDVPATNGSIYAPGTMQAELKLSIVETLNRVLSEEAENYGLTYKSLHLPSQNGWGVRTDFIDRFHLCPNKYIPLLEQL